MSGESDYPGNVCAEKLLPGNVCKLPNQGAEGRVLVATAEGRRIEALKAQGCPLPSRLGDLGERRELPPQSPGRGPGRKGILDFGVF